MAQEINIDTDKTLDDLLAQGFTPTGRKVVQQSQVFEYQGRNYVFIIVDDKYRLWYDYKPFRLQHEG